MTVLPGLSSAHPVPTADIPWAGGVQVHWCHLGVHPGAALPPAGVLDARELARWKRLTRVADRDRLLGSRLLAKVVLGQTRGAPPGAVVLGADERGRPLWIDDLTQHLSISHSGHLVAVAVARHPLGIDVEAGDDLIAEDRLAARHFSAGESQALARLAPELRQQAFLGLWTAKEALAKASGSSLDAVLSWDLSALLDPSLAHPKAVVVEADAGADAVWVVESLGTWRGCQAALARPRAAQRSPLTVREWTLSTLLAAWGQGGTRT